MISHKAAHMLFIYGFSQSHFFFIFAEVDHTKTVESHEVKAHITGKLGAILDLEVIPVSLKQKDALHQTALQGAQDVRADIL